MIALLNNNKSLVHMIFLRAYAAILVSALVSMLVSCATGSGSNSGDELTLQSLEDAAIDINPQDLPKVKQVEAQSTYKAFLKSTNNQELRARALERLADIELDTKHDEKVEQDKQRDIRKANIAKKGVDLSGQLEIEKVQEIDFVLVAQQYEALLKKYPTSDDNERILYQLARAYDLSGQSKKSLNALSRLVSRYPKSKRMEEIQFRRGEILFFLKKYKKAAQAYKVILVNRDSSYYERSLYKHGWSLFKLNKMQPALRSFYALLDRKLQGEVDTDHSRSESELVNDTLRVVSLAYSFQKGAETIQVFSNNNGRRKYEHQIYQRLAALYLKQERYEDAALAYTAFVERFPSKKQSPLFMIKVIDIYKNSGFPRRLLSAKADFVTHYGMSKVFWQNQDDGLLEDVEAHIKINLNDLARHYHAKGQKTKKANDFKFAAHWYNEYVRSFPDDPKTPGMNFLHAEVLNDNADYHNAASQYETTAYKYSAHGKSSEAGYAAVLTFQKIAKISKGRLKSQARLDAIASARKFAKFFPNDKRTPKVLLKVAEEQLELKLLADASATANQLTSSNNPYSKTLKKAAWAIVASAEFALGNHKAAELASMQRLRGVGRNKKERKVHVERLAAAVYKQGEKARDEGRLVEAAEQFLRVSSLAPGSKIRPTAEYDAAAALLQAEKWDRAIPVLNRFVLSFPKHKFTPDAIEKLASTYEKNEKWVNAARVYEKIIRNEASAARQRDLLWHVAGLYEKTKRTNDIVKIYKRYIKKHAKPVEQATEARIKIANIYKAKKLYNKRRYWLKEIISSDKKDGSTERTKFLAASATLELAAPTYRAYKKVRLVLPLKKNLKKKKKLLKASINAYTKAANYGIAEITTASTYKIAEIYNEFSKGLFSSERPPGLSEAELEQYDFLLEEQAFPFEEKAIELHETNADRATGGVYDKWVKQSFKALGEMKPVRYSKNERSDTFFGVLN